MSDLGRQFEELVHEGCENFISEYDFGDIVKDIIKDEVDVEKEVEDAIGAWDFSDSIHDAVKDYDWWEEIEGKVEDEIQTRVEEAQTEIESKLDEFKEQIKERFESPEFETLVKEIVIRMIKAKIAAIKVRIKDVVLYPYTWMRS